MTDEAPDPAADLSRAIERAVQAAIPAVDFAAARQAANEAGITAATTSLHDALEALARSQTELRAAQDAERLAAEELSALEAEVAWEVEGRIVVEGAKRFVLTDEDETETQMTLGCPDCPDGGKPGHENLSHGAPVEVAVQVPTGKKVRRQVTAEQAKEWTAAQVGANDGVRAAKAALAKRHSETEAAKDGIALGDKRFAAARLGVEAAIAVLTTLQRGLGAK